MEVMPVMMKGEGTNCTRVHYGEGGGAQLHQDAL